MSSSLSYSDLLVQASLNGSLILQTLTIRHIKVMIFSTSAIPRAELARFIISGVDGLTLQFISDRDTHRARRDLDHLIAAVITLAGITPST